MKNTFHINIIKFSADSTRFCGWFCLLRNLRSLNPIMNDDLIIWPNILWKIYNRMTDIQFDYFLRVDNFLCRLYKFLYHLCNSIDWQEFAQKNCSYTIYIERVSKMKARIAVREWFCCLIYWWINFYLWVHLWMSQFVWISNNVFRWCRMTFRY